MHGIFNTENMRAVGEFRGLILVAHNQTPFCKGISHRFSFFSLSLYFISYASNFKQSEADLSVYHGLMHLSEIVTFSCVHFFTELFYPPS